MCKRAAYLGSRVEYVVDTQWSELLIFDHEARRLHARDESIGVSFDADAAILLSR